MIILKKKCKNIIFKDKIFDVLICLDADLPSKRIIEKFKNILIIAADGAAIKLFKKNVEPNYIIGDLDTFSKSEMASKEYKSEIIFIPEQEHNDFEKVLMFAIEHHYNDVLIFGFHGGVLEHTLNNWSVLLKYSDKINMCIYDKGRYALPMKKDSFEIIVKKGELISIIPMTEAVLKTQNLKWNLNNELLKIGYREGARNIAINDKIYIEIIKGAILLFIDARLPFAPELIAK